MIGLLGAVMDAATDIVSTLFEMKRDQPELTKQQLFKSGQVIGRSVMGPLINVLLLIFLPKRLQCRSYILRQATALPIRLNGQWL